MPGYSTDLAYIHDAAFGDVAAEAAQAVLSAFGKRRGFVVDLGCGSGRLAQTLVDAGFALHGIDISPSK